MSELEEHEEHDEMALLRRARAGHRVLRHGRPFGLCEAWPCADLREAALAIVDAEVARWYVNDGQLSEEPLGPVSEKLWELRERRRDVLVATPQRDPHPAFMRPPTDDQREAWERRRQG